MALTFNVPLPQPLAQLTQSAGNFRIDQITRLFFQQYPQATPSFANAAAMQNKANWDALIAAGDVTTIAYSPVFAGPKVTESKRLEQAGDSNNTFAGIPETYGKGTVRFSGTFRCKDAASMLALDALFQYSQQNTQGNTGLGVYMANSAKPYGMFFPNADFSAIPVWNYMANSRMSDGYAAPDLVNFAFDMLSTWADNLVCVIPTFDPNTSYAV